MSQPTAPAGADIDTLAGSFADPSTTARPMLRWWWPGGAVDAGALCAQLRGFAAAGWGGVEIQPFRIGLPHPLPAAAAQAVHEVFTPAYFETLATVMDEAQALGLTVDTTFGSCWPFGGGAAITPELATQELTLAWTSVQGPSHFNGPAPMPARPARFGTRMEAEGSVPAEQALPPAWHDRIAALTRVEAVLALRGGPPSLGLYPGFVPLTLPDRWGQVLAAGGVDAAATIDLTDRLQPGGRLAWDVPPGNWQIVSVVRFVSDQRITAAAGLGPQLVLDHLKREAFEAHAARVGGASLAALARHAGSTWRAVFVDSLEIPTDLLWTDDFAAEFERRRGYALRPGLPLLLQPGWRNHFQARVGAPLFDDPDAGPRWRADYRLTVSELMIERLYAPFAGWAHQHRLQARVQAHGAPVDWLQAYGLADIPETEDLANGAAPHFLRMARSAAHLYGRPLVSAEAFCWLLEGLAVTPQQLRERADDFFVHGAQQLIGHGASAPLLGQPSHALPWYPFEGMEFGTPLDNASPLGPMLRPLTDYIARTQTILQRGRAVVPVAVLAPLDAFAFDGGADRQTPPPWHGALLDAGLDWDWINPDALLRSRLDGKALVTPGGHRYSALLLPDLPALRAEVAERLAEAASAGMPVWALGAAPQREEGWLDAPARDRRVRAAMAQALQHGTRVVPMSAAGQALRQAGVAPVLDLPAGHGLQFTLRQDGPQRWLLLRNPAPKACTLRLPLAPGQGAELWHTWTGRRERLAGGDGAACLVALPARGARLLRLAPLADILPLATPPTPMAAGRPTPGTPVQTLAGPWQVQASGHGLDGRHIAFAAEWPALQDLSQQADHPDFAGSLVYQADLHLSPADLDQGPLWLDLGRVCDAAKVQVGSAAAVIGCEPPFVFDIHAALQPGRNRVTVTVANRPENARRDPARPGGLPLPGRRLSRLPTGLLGPVRLITATAPATRWRIT